MKSGLDAHAAGASAIIYGLLAVCMVWAPRNELNCIAIFIIGFRTLVFHWDLYYTTVAILYVGEQVCGLVFWGAIGGRLMLSELGHLSGAFWGAVVAVILVKARLVDCEGWDLFSLWVKRRKLAQDWKKRGERLDHAKVAERSYVKSNARAKSSKRKTDAALDGPSQEERAAAAVRRVQSLIEEGNVAEAMVAYDKATRTLFDWPSQPDLYALIKVLHARGAEADSIRLMREHCRCFPRESTKMRIKLAQILIRDRQRPVAALRVLDEIPAGALPADLESTRQKLTSKAKRMLEEGVLELEGDD
jgi:hypothetical protein